MLAKFISWYSQAGKGLSIHARTLLSVSIALVLFLLLAGAVLDNYFRHQAENNLRDQLQNQIYALLAAANEDQDGRMRLPEFLSNPMLNRPDSGLIAWVGGEKGKYQWHSPSYLGSAPALKENILQHAKGAADVQTGQFHYTAEFANNAHLSLTIIWEDINGKELSYTLQMVRDRVEIDNQIHGFRAILWQWFMGLIVILLLVQGWALNWGLRPLRQAGEELQSIEKGDKQQLAGQYPIELRHLTKNINSLLQHSASSLQRYRNSLGDLAHSLKTPLAVLQSAYDSQKPQLLRDATDEQLQRINELIAYQLQKAAIMGEGPVTVATSVQPVIEKIISALNKVYADKQVQCTVKIEPDVVFRGDQGDLMEVAGNLLDNAYKYCQQQVFVEVKSYDQQFFSFIINDDGPDIPRQHYEYLLQRGKRADEHQRPAGVDGHGIGLSIVTEMVHLYHGQILMNPDTDHKRLQGLYIQLLLPAINRN